MHIVTVISETIYKIGLDILGFRGSGLVGACCCYIVFVMRALIRLLYLFYDCRACVLWVLNLDLQGSWCGRVLRF